MCGHYHKYELRNGKEWQTEPINPRNPAERECEEWKGGGECAYPIGVLHNVLLSHRGQRGPFAAVGGPDGAAFVRLEFAYCNKHTQYPCHQHMSQSRHFLFNSKTFTCTNVYKAKSLSWNSGKPHGAKPASNGKPPAEFAPFDSPWERPYFNSKTLPCAEKNV